MGLRPTKGGGKTRGRPCSAGLQAGCADGVHAGSMLVRGPGGRRHSRSGDRRYSTEREAGVPTKPGVPIAVFG